MIEYILFLSFFINYDIMFTEMSGRMNQVKLNEVLILDIKRLGINGEGIAFYKKQTIFVLNAIPKEVVEVKIIEANDKYAKGVVTRYIEQSVDRQIPKCKYYNRCGGCQMQHIAYDKQLEFKKEIVMESLRKYSGLNPRSFEVRNVIGMDNPYGYRNKSSLPTSYDGNRSVVGIYQLNDQKLVFIDECIIQHELINKINNEILKLMDKNTITAFNHKTNEGHIKYIVCRVGLKTLEAQVTLVVNQESSKINKLAKDIIKLENVVSVYKSDTPEFGIFGKNLILLEGKKEIIEKLGRFNFQLLPNSFFQLNPVQTEKLYDLIKKSAKLSNKEVVLDAYCGVGTISLWISKNAKKVVGIDSNKEAILNAKENALLNNIKNVEFYAGDIYKTVDNLEYDFDVLICDPPRTGLDKMSDFILKKLPKRVIYVSCNPAMLSKDLKKLKEKYIVNQIELIDMFPNTSHVECVCQLSLKK